MTKSPSSKSTRLRAYPWPYRAALAFSNDCDYATLTTTLGIHQLFGTPESEGGLGLELSNSFFFYHHGAPFPTYTYFNGLTPEPTAAAPVIRQMAASGYIDTTHALGDFDGGGFSRELAERALDEFKRHNLSLPVWSNHGGFGNVQNIGSKDFAYHHCGDDLMRPFYMLDIAEDFGVRYFWLDGLQTRRIALKPTGPMAPEPIRRAPREVRLGGVHGIQRSSFPGASFDRHDIFETVETRAGTRLQCFVRYNPYLPGSDAQIDDASAHIPGGRRPGPNIGRLADELTPRLLDSLIAAQGCAFLYQHFATLAHVPKRVLMTEAIEFHPANLEALRRLKSYEDRGLIWVAAQAILLDYLYTTNTIAVDVKREGENWRIDVAPQSGFELRDISGLAVEIGAPAQRATFVPPDGRKLAGQIAGPDGDGKTWAYLPVRRLPKIAWPEVANLAGVQLPQSPRITLLNGSKAVSLLWPG